MLNALHRLQLDLPPCALYALSDRFYKYCKCNGDGENNEGIFACHGNEWFYYNNDVYANNNIGNRNDAGVASLSSDTSNASFSCFRYDSTPIPLLSPPTSTLPSASSHIPSLSRPLDDNLTLNHAATIIHALTNMKGIPDFICLAGARVALKVMTERRGRKTEIERRGQQGKKQTERVRSAFTGAVTEVSGSAFTGAAAEVSEMDRTNILLIFSCVSKLGIVFPPHVMDFIVNKYFYSDIHCFNINGKVDNSNSSSNNNNSHNNGVSYTNNRSCNIHPVICENEQHLTMLLTALSKQNYQDKTLINNIVSILVENFYPGSSFLPSTSSFSCSSPSASSSSPHTSPSSFLSSSYVHSTAALSNRFLSSQGLASSLLALAKLDCAGSWRRKVGEEIWNERWPGGGGGIDDLLTAMANLSLKIFNYNNVNMSNYINIYKNNGSSLMNYCNQIMSCCFAFAYFNNLDAMYFHTILTQNGFVFNIIQELDNVCSKEGVGRNGYEGDKIAEITTTIAGNGVTDEIVQNRTNAENIIDNTDYINKVDNTNHNSTYVNVNLTGGRAAARAQFLTVVAHLILERRTQIYSLPLRTLRAFMLCTPEMHTRKNRIHRKEKQVCGVCERKGNNLSTDDTRVINQWNNSVNLGEPPLNRRSSYLHKEVSNCLRLCIGSSSNDCSNESNKSADDGNIRSGSNIIRHSELGRCKTIMMDGGVSSDYTILTEEVQIGPYFVDLLLTHKITGRSGLLY